MVTAAPFFSKKSKSNDRIAILPMEIAFISAIIINMKTREV